MPRKSGTTEVVEVDEFMEVDADVDVDVDEDTFREITVEVDSPPIEDDGVDQGDGNGNVRTRGKLVRPDELTFVDWDELPEDMSLPRGRALGDGRGYTEVMKPCLGYPLKWAMIFQSSNDSGARTIESLILKGNKAGERKPVLNPETMDATTDPDIINKYWEFDVRKHYVDGKRVSSLWVSYNGTPYESE